MVHHVVEYLDDSARRYPEKNAFVDPVRAITYGQLQKESYHVAAPLVEMGLERRPVAIYLEKSVEAIAAFMGAVRSRNFYSPIDTEMPAPRIAKIMDTLKPEAVITDRAHEAAAREFSGSVPILLYEDLMEKVPDQEKIDRATAKILDTDLLYVLFTSGSTGVPKGVMLPERGIVDFIDWAVETFDINEKTIFGGQVPLYFIFSSWEVFGALKAGATTYFIPQRCFAFPTELMQYLYEKQVNTIVWVPTALSIVSTFHALESPYLTELKTVIFGGEVMPIKHLNRWMDAYPNTRFVNTYGSTEVIDTCAYYDVKRRLDKKEFMPIGVQCANKEILILDEENRPVPEGEIGELCVRGTGLACGYYGDPQRTEEVFIQNPLNSIYKELIYKTGDLVKYNDYHELVCVSRKDFQIKHMGYRIELGEIETVSSALDHVERVCCLYQKKRLKIVLFYQGDISEDDLDARLKELLPPYMVPNEYVKLHAFPINLNGKIDRQALTAMM